MRVQHGIGRQAGWTGIRSLTRFLPERGWSDRRPDVSILCVHILHGQYDTTFALQNSAKHNTNEHINIEKDIDRHGLGGSTLSLLQK